jgi:hypothetical protein
MRRDLRWKKEDSMARFHLSIVSLMVVMIPLAIGLAAIRSATQLWVNLVSNLVVHYVMSLLFALLGATVFRYFAARRLASDHARRQLGGNSPSA